MKNFFNSDQCTEFFNPETTDATTATAIRNDLKPVEIAELKTIDGDDDGGGVVLVTDGDDVDLVGLLFDENAGHSNANEIPMKNLKALNLNNYEGGSLDFRGRDVKGITLPTTIAGSLNLSGCGDLKGITLPTTIGWALDLTGCDLKGITLPTTIGGYLDLTGCNLKGITLPTTIAGSLYLSGCDLSGVTLPTTIGGSLDLRGCNLKGITLPTTIGGYLYLRGCENVPNAGSVIH